MQTSIMAIFLLMTIITLSATILAAKDAGDVCHGGQRQFGPGFTIMKKGGQYLKVLGPVYGTLLFQGDFKLPMKLSEKLNVSIMVQPSKEIYTLFASGKVYYEGQPVVEYNEEDDLCMGSSSICPLRRCGIVKKLLNFDLRDAGLLPGFYTGKIDLFSYDEHYKKFHLAGIELRIKLNE